MCNLNANKLNSIADRFPRGQIVLTIPLRMLYIAAKGIAWGIKHIAILIKGE